MKNVTYYNAGAGSGKTYKLTHIFAKLIREKGYQPSEFILTTFTNDAAADFREKTRSVLYEEHLFDAAACMDNAEIGTIHSVANNLVCRYWYLLGLSPQMNVMGEEDTNFYISQSLSSIPTKDDLRLFREFQKEFYVVKNANGFGNKAEAYADFWKDWLKGIIEYAVSYGISSMDESVEVSLKTILEIFGTDKHKKLVPMQTIKAVLKETKSVVECSAQNDINSSRLKEIDRFLNISHWCVCDYIKLGGFLSGLTQKQKAKVPQLDIVATELCGIYQIGDVYNKLEIVIRRVFQLADEWLGNYKEYKREHNVIDYNDMERYMLDLMEIPEISNEMTGKYKCLMVDEFQDCSPIQVKIFSKLSELMECTYMCGDSKQAIYAFRGSDIELTSAVSEIIEKGKKDNNFAESLEMSYRSQPTLVYFSNSLFTKIFDGVLSSDKVVLKPDKQPIPGECNLLHWHSETSSKADLLNDVARKIKDYSLQNDIPYRDIAVLAKKNKELSTVAEHLQELGVPVNLDAGSLLLQKEIELLISLLALIVDFKNELAKAKIAYLTGGFKDVSLLIDNKLEYDSIKQSEDTEEEKTPWLQDNILIGRLGTVRTELSNLNVSSQLESLYVELGIQSYLQRWGKSVQRESNVMKLIQMAHQYEEHCELMTLGATTTGFLDYINGTDAATAGDKEGVILKTYHGSKGLEWKNVILLSLGNNQVEKNKMIRNSFFGLNKMREEAPSAANLYPQMKIRLMPWIFGNDRSVPSEMETKILNHNIYQDTEQSSLQESARLLYVGVTRACNQLITVGNNGSNPFLWLENLGVKPAKVSNTDTEVDLFSTGYLSKVEQMSEVDDSEGMVENDGDMQKEIFVLPLSYSDEVHDARYLSPSHSGLNSQADIEIVGDSNKRINLAGNPDMAEIGTCIHNIFASGRVTQEVAERIISDFEFQSYLESPQQICEAWTFLEDYLKENFGEPTHIYHELAFMQQMGNQIVRGSMDLVWETPNGCVLVDFKTFPGRKDCLTDKTNAHYAGNYKPQFDFYTHALEESDKIVLRRYVYYPVNGTIVELK